MDFEFKNHKSLIFICLIIFPIIFFVILYTQITYAQSSIEVRRAQLENNLEIIEEEIETQQTLLQDKQRERVSFERDVAILEAQIEKTKLSIKARDIQRLQKNKIEKRGTNQKRIIRAPRFRRHTV